MEDIHARIEYKYYLPLPIKSFFLVDLKKFTKADQYAIGKELSYKVVSIYFDNLDIKSYHDKLSGAAQRVKLRLRYYPTTSDSLSQVNIEVKYKILDNVVKKKTRISYQLFLNILQSNFSKFDFDDSDPVISSILRLIRVNKFYPFVRIDYLRSAFYATNDQYVRITIDSNVVCNRFSGDMHLKPHIPVLPAGMEILEIKSPNYFPFWLSYIIKKYSLSRTAVSKYMLSVQNLAVNNTLFIK